jgi:hypothetical protein
VSVNNIYVGGVIPDSSNNPVGYYWKNGSPIPLTSKGTRAGPNHIAISGGDIYVSGLEYDGVNFIATYWKNGNPVRLTNGMSGTGSIAVLGNDVYVAGWESDNSSSILATGAKYWKNGISQPLALSSSDANLTSIFISPE